MEGELGAGARIAIALIVLAVLLSVIFIILGFTRGTTNEGIVSVQNSMDAMTLARFDDYDQKILSGSQVKSALKLFEGQPVGMIVVNILPNRGVTTGSYGVATQGYSQPSSDVGIVKIDGSEISWKGYNYGALFKGAEASTVYREKGEWLVGYSYGDNDTLNSLVSTEIGGTPANGVAGVIWRGGDFSYYIGNLDTKEDGSNKTNNIYSGTSKSGTSMFIRPTAKYIARLVKDTTGTISGIVFMQTT